MEQLWDITVGGLLDKMAQDYPDRDAVIYTDRDFRKTYKEFNEICNKVAKGFLSLGIKKGDHVAIWATNYPEWLITQFATAKIGAVLVTVNTNYKKFELEYLLKQSDSTTLILIDGFKDSNYLKIINELCPELKSSKPGKLNSEKFPMLKNIIHIGEQKNKGMFNFDDLYEYGEVIEDEKLNKIQSTLHVNDVINMQYTSGTTGFPKGVMLTHYNIVNNGKQIGDCMKLTSEDKLCIPVPFFHCFGCVLGVLACVTHGATMVPVESFNPKRVLDAVSKENCTAVHGVPTMFISMLEYENFKDYSLNLRTGIMAGSPCPIEVMKKVVGKMGADEITIAFGQTEASPVCTQTTTDDSIERRVATVGKTLPGIECKVVDPDTYEELPYNTPGEFVARGYNIMKGYYKMPEATESTIDDDGWLHTGDLATMDENGYFKIVGRIKDMIIRGGENIYPKEIEEFLYTHPKISDVQVIGVPSKKYGEEIMAYIILKDGESMTVEDVKEAVVSNMARHKTPSYVKFTDEFPMTASGKIQKYKLREQAIEDFGLEDVASIKTA